MDLFHSEERFFKGHVSCFAGFEDEVDEIPARDLFDPDGWFFGDLGVLREPLYGLGLVLYPLAGDLIQILAFSHELEEIKIIRVDLGEMNLEIISPLIDNDVSGLEIEWNIDSPEKRNPFRFGPPGTDDKEDGQGNSAPINSGSLETHCSLLQRVISPSPLPQLFITNRHFIKVFRWLVHFRHIRIRFFRAS